jgi:hypothetical protein
VLAPLPEAQQTRHAGAKLRREMSRDMSLMARSPTRACAAPRPLHNVPARAAPRGAAVPPEPRGIILIPFYLDVVANMLRPHQEVKTPGACRTTPSGAINWTRCAALGTAAALPAPLLANTSTCIHTGDS